MEKEIIYVLSAEALDKIKKDVPLTSNIEKISVQIMDDKPKIIVDYFYFGRGKQELTRKSYD